MSVHKIRDSSRSLAGMLDQGATWHRLQTLSQGRTTCAL
jgi:hypothetical protein